MNLLWKTSLCFVMAACAAGCGSSTVNNPTDDGGSISVGATGGSGGAGGAPSDAAAGGTTETGAPEAGTYYWKLTGGYVGQFADSRLGTTITTTGTLWSVAAGNGNSDPVDIGVIVNFSAAPQVGTTYTLTNVASETIVVNNKKAASFAAWDAGDSYPGSSMQLTFSSVSQALAGAHGAITATLVPTMLNDADAKSPVQLEGKF
jgi:hypothetical protein